MGFQRSDCQVTLFQNAANTHANQWLERTLDDSAIRRIVLPEGFMATDVILSVLANIADGLHVRLLNTIASQI
jgi:adenylosuccinate lyase